MLDIAIFEVSIRDKFSLSVMRSPYIYVLRPVLHKIHIINYYKSQHSHINNKCTSSALDSLEAINWWIHINCNYKLAHWIIWKAAFDGPHFFNVILQLGSWYQHALLRLLSPTNRKNMLPMLAFVWMPNSSKPITNSIYALDLCTPITSVYFFRIIYTSN